MKSKQKTNKEKRCEDDGTYKNHKFSSTDNIFIPGNVTHVCLSKTSPVFIRAILPEISNRSIRESTKLQLAISIFR